MLLSSEEIHVWSVGLGSTGLSFDDAFSVLSSCEQITASRFHREMDRHRYVFSHAACRIVLSRYLVVSPKDIAYQKENNNKPFIKGVNDLRFNLSHSNEMALIAVAKGAIGVDIECCERVINQLEIAKRYFTETEYALLCSASSADRKNLFFRIWTLKEAYLKAKGVGLVYGLDSFEVSLANNKLKNKDGLDWLTLNSALPDSSWWLQSIPAAPGYMAAVCTIKPVVSVKPYFFHNLPDFSDIFC